MRALLTPEIAMNTGVVLLKPGRDLLPMFRGRVLICTPPGELSHLPSGLINDSSQPLLDEPQLTGFFTDMKVIGAAGGLEKHDAWVQRIGACQLDIKDSYHHPHYTTIRTESGAVCLCYAHDNYCRGNGTPRALEGVGVANVSRWVIESACLQMGLGADHRMTLPELCWWACLKGVIDLIPETHARRVLRMPAQVTETGAMPEALITPATSAREIIQDKAEVVKQVLRISVDPESPMSFMARPKRLRWSNEKYTRWVKAQPCACCRKRADDPHHIIGHGQGGMGTKAHDLFVIPLCRTHHDELHRDMKAFEDKYGSQLELLVRFLDHSIAVGVVG
ncbi:DUF968 domain-containing protein [Pantoea sp. Mb-10]|uniref:DUF968 domain-containing protein n=1 Tax=unclassified Pantoea TaxID=2630326 RepID=UPI001E41EA4C|nr:MULTISPECIES: DUF968 domain-containing protein [unclassified Pantoea]MCE0490972.1 DUF968 domain-containing protein [Pantoea sp. Mb-10]MCE0499870.1 DUF968 domain-containing protein [Pantoea sp. Pb-8]